MSISVFESVSLGFIDFWTRRLRNIITLIGIVLGIMSIIIILSIVNGLREATQKWMMETGGLKKMEIRKDWSYTDTSGQADFFNMREFNFIREAIPPVEAISASVQSGGMISHGSATRWTQLVGTFPDYQKIEEWSVSEGRFLSHFDYVHANDVIVIGSTIKNDLFGNKNAIGQYVNIRGKRLMVVGVMDRKFLDMGMMNFGNQNPLEWYNLHSFVPVSTKVHKLSANDRLDVITIRLWDERDAYTLKPAIEDILLNLRKGRPIFSVASNQEQADKNEEASGMIQIVFFFISSISLLVGGIVIMNIQLATIKERTREIGIRLSVGARQIDIFLQFLVQSVVVTICGGVIGVVLAFVSVKHIGDALKMSPKTDISMVVVALLVSAVVGLFFGIYPAVKAAKLDPVKALRNE